MKLDIRGGARTPKKLKTSQARLLDALWRQFGGASKVARLLGVPVQTPINWRNRGFVPLELVGKVARQLHVEPQALNYEGVVSVQEDGTPWSCVVEQTINDLDIQLYVLKGKHPKSFEELVKDE